MRQPRGSDGRFLDTKKEAGSDGERGASPPLFPEGWRRWQNVQLLRVQPPRRLLPCAIMVPTSMASPLGSAACELVVHSFVDCLRRGAADGNRALMAMAMTIG
ncbi:hypothetical protein GUJ93_ZPchr0005g16086 [Zizania palustris]|uniref:Uncharacterized protein n=1 Tax=Zizania palustris TaxID=103762 RepID=A0A8J5T9M2_ZIZPA|nr:hypothetical protein GUJ93_ZPchr0005g16086 [Zizania palustris]